MNIRISKKLFQGGAGKRAIRAFTLIELLTVIAIIGILAALILSLSRVASAKSHISRVQAERDALVTAIDSYKHDKGYYPPDNQQSSGAIDTVASPLFYELTGNLTSANGFFTNLASGEVISGNTFTTYFNTGGFLNVGATRSDTRNYYPSLKSDSHAIITYNNGTQQFSVFGTRVDGPLMLPVVSGPNSAANFNPVHYNKSNPTNNPNSYDLWFDVNIGGVTNRISNWRDTPEPL